MASYHTRPPDQAEDPERIAIREALAFGKAVYDQRRALGLSVCRCGSSERGWPVASVQSAGEPPRLCRRGWLRIMGTLAAGEFWFAD
jgi:hypothetical protein